MTYRARLEGTSETDSGSLISLIEDWVSSGTSIIVTGILMTVDSKCSVAISSLNEGECVTSQSESSSDNTSTAVIIGGVVVIVVIIAIVISTAIVAMAFVKSRRGSVSAKKTEE